MANVVIDKMFAVSARSYHEPRLGCCKSCHGWMQGPCLMCRKYITCCLSFRANINKLNLIEHLYSSIGYPLQQHCLRLIEMNLQSYTIDWTRVMGKLWMILSQMEDKLEALVMHIRVLNLTFLLWNWLTKDCTHEFSYSLPESEYSFMSSILGIIFAIVAKTEWQWQTVREQLYSYFSTHCLNEWNEMLSFLFFSLTGLWWFLVMI